MKTNKTQVHSKVGGATVGGAFSIVFAWLLSSYGFEIPLEVAGAFSTLFAFAGGWVASS